MSIILVLTVLMGLQALAFTGLALLAHEGMVRPPKGRTILGTLRGATVGAGPCAQTVLSARLRRADQSKQLRAARLASEAQARMFSSSPSKRVSTRLEGLTSKASRRRQRREEAAALEQALQHPRLDNNRKKRAKARKTRLERWLPKAAAKAVKAPNKWGQGGTAFTPPSAAKAEKGKAVWRLRCRQAALAKEWAGLEVRRLDVRRRIKSLELRLRGLEASRRRAASDVVAALDATARHPEFIAALKDNAAILAAIHSGAAQLRAQKGRLEATDLSLYRAQEVVDVQLNRLGVLLRQEAA